MSMATHISSRIWGETHSHDDPIEMRMGPRKLQIEHAGLHAPNPVVSRMAQG